MSRPIKDVRTFRADGEDAFHVIDLEGGGFVVTAADDRIEPIIAFADEGTLVADEKNPLWVLLNLDLPQRMKAHRSGKVTLRDLSKRRGRGRQKWKEPAAAWRELTGDDDLQTQKNATASSVSDVRVAALVQSTWNQSTVNGKACYNVYTPNGYVCGCVATAGAQLMRYWQYPTASVAAVTKSCWVDDVATDKKMIGGTYDWANMPLKPSSSITTTQCEAIGKLCYDVGVSTRMDWTSSGSGACSGVLAESLVSVFGYQNAKCEMTGSLTTDKTEDAIYANLDAGCPVLLGIHTSNGAGHEIVADGYGLSGSVIYTHLNLGWSGSNDAWYALPSVSAGGYNFTTVSSVVYNVFPDKTGELITGRVLDTNGNPIEGATVTAVNRSTTRTAKSNAKGIYALNVTSGKTWTISVTADGYADGTLSVSSGTSSSSGLGEVSSGSYSYYNNGKVGNSWGNDVTLRSSVITGPVPTGIVVNGPSSVYKGTTASFVCAAKYSDGSVVPVSSATWSISGNTTTSGFWFWGSTTTHATLSSTGALTASSEKTGITVTAKATVEGESFSASATVAVVKSSVAPANDAFAAATSLANASGSASVDSTQATDESGEPLLKYVASAVATVWWKWTAPSTGRVRFDTVGSAYDTVMGVYSGSSLSSLTAVAQNNDRAAEDSASECSFVCQKGTTYYVTVGGWCGTRGTTKLNWQMMTAVSDPTVGELVYSGRAQGLPAGDAFVFAGTSVATNAGSYSATATLRDGYCWSDGSLSAHTVNWSIGKAALVVAATNATVRAGDPLPTFGATYSGFVAGETERALTGRLVFSCGYDAATAKAYETYPIVPSGLSAANYAITYQSGTLTVEQGAQIVPGGVAEVTVPSDPTPSQIDEAVQKVDVVIADTAAAAAGQAAVVKKVGVYNPQTGKVEVSLAIDTSAAAYVEPDEAVDEIAEALSAVGSGGVAVDVKIPATSLTPGLYYSVRAAGDLGGLQGNGGVEGERVLADGHAISLPVPQTNGFSGFYRIVQSLTKE